jgi:hypothetical protein
MGQYLEHKKILENDLTDLPSCKMCKIEVKKLCRTGLLKIRQAVQQSLYKTN